MSYGSLDTKTSLARLAHSKNDPTLSRLAHNHHHAHNTGKHNTTQQRAVEGHRLNGDLVKSIVYGGLDGVLTSFAIISGAQGGGLGLREVLILGISNLFADALSMGVGDTVSTIAYNEHVMHERSRECWEYDNYKEGEIEEMVDLYEQRGLPRNEASEVVETMAKYRDFFIDVMMSEELKLTVPDEDDNPYWEGFITFLSFLVFGFLPLLSYVILPQVLGISEDYLFLVACLVTMVVLFLLGSFKSRFSSKSWKRSGIEFLLLGSSAASTSYLVGILVSSLASEWFELQPTPL